MGNVTVEIEFFGDNGEPADLLEIETGVGDNVARGEEVFEFSTQVGGVFVEDALDVFV